MATGLMKLPENRVRRNYTGGAGIDRLHGKARQEDNNMPMTGSFIWAPPAGRGAGASASCLRFWIQPCGFMYRPTLPPSLPMK